MLEFNDLKKYYYDSLVLDIPEFKIGDGIYRLMGRNGSGKTTLIKILAGLLSFDGNISLDGVSLRSSPILQRKRINYTEADPVFPPFLSGRDFLNLFAATKGGSEHEFNEMITHLRLEHFVASPIGTYSAGMLKKLAIAIALIGEQRVVLLDEPFANIESESLELIYHLINDRHRKLNNIFIIVTHQDASHGALNFDGQIAVENNTLTWI